MRVFRVLRYPSLAARGAAAQWAILIALSALFVFILERSRLPAALMLGPMLAGILVAAAHATVRVPDSAFVLAQGVVGCMIARVIRPSLVSDVVADWPLILIAVFTVIAASAALGWLLARWRVLPGSTALWGSFPGAATAMVLMAEAYGADVRLVAFMQYLRVVCVASTASIVARMWAMGGRFANVVWFPPLAPLSFLETLALVGPGAFVARALRIPAGPLLLPLFLGAVLQDSKLMTIDLPPWLLAASYAVIGWIIGLRFTRPILIYAARALPRVVAAILALIGVCALFSIALAALAKVDPMTAYLAMSPGGADSVAIIAASSNKVDVPFVMALQTARFVVVLLIGPWLARLIAHRAGYKQEIL